MSRLVTQSKPSGWIRQGKRHMKPGHKYGERFHAFYPMDERAGDTVYNIVERNSPYVTGNIDGAILPRSGDDAYWHEEGGVALPGSAMLQIPNALQLPDGGFCIFFEFEPLINYTTSALGILFRDLSGINNGDIQIVHADVGGYQPLFFVQTAGDAATAKPFTSQTLPQLGETWRMVLRLQENKRTAEAYAVSINASGYLEGYAEVTDSLVSDFVGTVATVTWTLGAVGLTPGAFDAPLIAKGFGVTDMDMTRNEIIDFLADPWDMVEYEHEEIGLFNPALYEIALPFSRNRFGNFSGYSRGRFGGR